MKFFLRMALACVLALMCSSLFAQDNTVTFSATADYTGALPKTVAGVKSLLKSHEVLPGGQVDLSAKLAGIFHLDFSVNYSQKPGVVQASVAGGPGIVLGKNTQFFADVLMGGVHESQARPKLADLKDSAFASFARAGVRHFFGKGHIGIESALRYGYSEAYGGSESDVGASAGLVVRF